MVDWPLVLIVTSAAVLSFLLWWLAWRSRSKPIETGL